MPERDMTYRLICLLTYAYP